MLGLSGAEVTPPPVQPNSYPCCLLKPGEPAVHSAVQRLNGDAIRQESRKSIPDGASASAIAALSVWSKTAGLTHCVRSFGRRPAISVAAPGYNPTLRTSHEIIKAGDQTYVTSARKRSQTQAGPRHPPRKARALRC
jgi:hypothetical protein